MVHYLMLKLDCCRTAKWVFDLATETFSGLCKDTDYIKDAQVISNCIQRDGNADILIILQLKDKAALNQYLAHPVHIAFAKKVDPYLMKRTSFDWCK